MKPEESLLIVGGSTRAAAFSALRAGLRPWCADLFADLDLQQRLPSARAGSAALSTVFAEAIRAGTSRTVAVHRSFGELRRTAATVGGVATALGECRNRLEKHSVTVRDTGLAKPTRLTLSESAGQRIQSAGPAFMVAETAGGRRRTRHPPLDAGWGQAGGCRKLVLAGIRGGPVLLGGLCGQRPPRPVVGRDPTTDRRTVVARSPVSLLRQCRPPVTGGFGARVLCPIGIGAGGAISLARPVRGGLRIEGW